MKDSKRPRFVESYDPAIGAVMMVIADVHYYMENEQEIAEWLLENTERGLNTKEGVVLNFANKEEALWFKMRWF